MTPQEPSRPLRVGVAGLGFGAAVHVPGFNALPGVSVVGLAARHVEKAAAAAAAAGVAASCGGIDDLLSLRPDAVSIALPPAEAEPAVAAALAAGVPVLAEKPLAATEDAAQRLAQAAHGLANGVDFQFAELETFAALRDLITSRELGGVRQVSVSWLTESYAQRRGTWSWKSDARAGGGVMSLLGCHTLYLLEWLLGPVAALSALLDGTATRAFAPDGADPAADTAQLILRTATGVPVAVSVSNAAPGEAHHRWDVVFDGGRARAVNVGADYMAGFRLDIGRDGGGWATVCQEPQTASDGRLPPFIRLAQRFVDAARGGQPMRPDFRDGARIQTLLAAAEESDRTGRSISVAPAERAY